MTTEDIVALLQKMGNEGTARVLRNHGAHDPCLGVKIGDMKPLQKQLKRNYLLSLELYDTGISRLEVISVPSPTLRSKLDIGSAF